LSEHLPPSRLEQARSLLGIATLIPAAGAGATVGLLRWNRRAGINVIGTTWFEAMLRVNGVRVKVVAGREHLRKPRPAFFVFNHKNNFDPVIVASLVRTDFAAVVKKEAAGDPVMGILSRVGDVVFLDRASPRAAVEQLKQLEGLARKGLSVLIAPEGTRSPDGALGPFKKGAFKVALATGLPVIPVVVRNAEAIGDRDASVMHPGTVEVAVLPPIDVTAWDARDLTAHTEAVRQQFEVTLGHWPSRLGA
jgi:putative phosphoserine phosphatase / 1-acylglycerol-3-phosphate O-acyltransferase